MAEQRTQTYATHTHQPLLSAWATAFGLIAFAAFAWDIVKHPSFLSLGFLCLSLSVLVLVAISRIYIVRLQDRIILLEMRMRLARLGREADYTRLSKRQLISLRFASDRELPSLADRAAAENLTGQQIKQAVQEWQPDFNRT